MSLSQRQATGGILPDPFVVLTDKLRRPERRAALLRL